MISRPYSVLIIDDEPEMCELLDTILAHHFRDILFLSVTSSTEKAIALLEKSKHHIVLTDLNMPSNSGYDICRTAINICKSTQVIFFTGHIDEAVFMTCFEEGAAGILFKPIDTKDLINIVSISIQRLDHWSHTYHHKLQSMKLLAE